MSTDTILVVGGTGMLGEQVAKQLLGDGGTSLCTGRRRSPSRTRYASTARW